MPSNATAGAIAVYRNATGAAAVLVQLSRSDAGARLRQIPAPSSTVELPSGTNDAESYSVIDQDGTCSLTHQIVIVPPAGETIRGAASLALTTAFVSATCIFDNETSDWAVEIYGSAGGGGGMTIKRNVVDVIGASETTSGVTINNNSSLDSAQQDVLNNDTSVASMNVYVGFTSAATIGSVDVSILPILNAASVVYADAAALVGSYTPTNGRFEAVANLPAARLPAARFFKIRVTNNATGADITDVFVGIETTVTS